MFVDTYIVISRLNHQTPESPWFGTEFSRWRLPFFCCAHPRFSDKPISLLYNHYCSPGYPKWDLIGHYCLYWFSKSLVHMFIHVKSMMSRKKHPYVLPYIYIYVRIYYRTKFSSQTSDNMDRWKSRGGKIQRREEKRNSQKKEDAGAWKGRKVAKHCVLPDDLWHQRVEK